MRKSERPSHFPVFLHATREAGGGSCEIAGRGLCGAGCGEVSGPPPQRRRLLHRSNIPCPCACAPHRRDLALPTCGFVQLCQPWPGSPLARACLVPTAPARGPRSPRPATSRRPICPAWCLRLYLLASALLAFSFSEQPNCSFSSWPRRVPHHTQPNFRLQAQLEV